MVDLVNIPAIDGIENAADTRLVLYQSGASYTPRSSRSSTPSPR
jgi:hypothetical protein